MGRTKELTYKNNGEKWEKAHNDTENEEQSTFINEFEKV